MCPNWMPHFASCRRAAGGKENAVREAGGIPAFLDMEDCGVVLETVKAAEDGNGYVLRFYEAKGGSARLKIKLHGFKQ